MGLFNSALTSKDGGMTASLRCSDRGRTFNGKISTSRPVPESQCLDSLTENVGSAYLHILKATWKIRRCFNKNMFIPSCSLLKQLYVHTSADLYPAIALYFDS